MMHASVEKKQQNVWFQWYQIGRTKLQSTKQKGTFGCFFYVLWISVDLLLILFPILNFPVIL